MSMIPPAVRRTRPLVLALAVVVGACIPAGVQRPSDAGSGRPTASIGPASATLAPTPSPLASGPSARPSFVRPTPTPRPTFLMYTVRPGDTLTSIARAFRTTARSLAFWNRSAHPSLDPDSPDYAPNRIEAGWVLLLIPDAEVDPEEFP
jgi:Tfp pilus assembly protein FimV